MEPEEVASTKAKASGSAGVESGDGATGYDETASSAPSVALQKVAMDINLPDIKPMGETEFYHADNLYEKINGRAPAYIGFNFQQLRMRSFSIAKSSGSFIDVYEYYMGTPINAFGIYALERDPKGRALAGVADGYSGDLGCYFRQGACYVQVIASDTKPETKSALRAIVDHRIKALPENNGGLEGRRKLPELGLIVDSIQYMSENAQGQSFLNNVFQAAYKFEEKRITFFVMVATPDKATGAWAQYKKFSEKFGKISESTLASGTKLFQCQNFGKWKAVYVQGDEIGGIIDSPDQETGRRFVESYLQGKLR